LEKERRREGGTGGGKEGREGGKERKIVPRDDGGQEGLEVSPSLSLSLSLSLSRQSHAM
jgi:hypothetical protein